MSLDIKFKFECTGTNSATGWKYSGSGLPSIPLKIGDNRPVFQITGKGFVEGIPGTPLNETSMKVELAWDVDVDDDGVIKFNGAPRSKILKDDLAKGDTFEVKSSTGTALLIMDAQMKIDHDVGPFNASDNGSERFKFSLISPPPKPKPITIPKIPPSLLDAEPILFEKEEDVSPKQDGVHHLKTWAAKLKDLEPLGDVISAGKLKIKVQAFASTTGTPAYNKKVTDNRAKVAETILKSLFKGSPKFDRKSYGKEKAEGSGAKFGYNRRVEIGIDGHEAKKAMEDFVKKLV